MKKFALETVLIIVLGFGAHQYLTWWGILVVAALVGFSFKHKNSFASYAAGFMAVFLLWAGYAGWLNYANLGLLSAKMGALFGGLDGNILVILTGLLGGILGGFAAMTGTLGRKMFGDN